VKTTGTFRPESKVDDYMHVHLRYENGPNVFVTASLLTASPLPSFVIHGTKGSFIKSRTDVQEDQLQAGMTPDDPEYGIEHDGHEGKLVSIDQTGERSTEYITALKGNYDRLFVAVYDAIRNEVPYPISEDDIMAQMQILEAK
jgi:predicted dehydrogenase